MFRAVRNKSAAVAALIASIASTAAVVITSRPATAEVGDAAPPPLIENFSYPDADTILAGQNIKLISGDGHILLVDCATPVEGDIGLLKIWTTDRTVGAERQGKVCFEIVAESGRLELEVPGVFEIRGDGQRVGTGHEITASLETDEGEKLTVEVDPDGSTPVGVGVDENDPPTVLLKLVVTG